MLGKRIVFSSNSELEPTSVCPYICRKACEVYAKNLCSCAKSSTNTTSYNSKFNGYRMTAFGADGT